MNLKWLSLLAIASSSAFALETEIVFSSNVVTNHTLTFKQPKLCDSTVVQYSGYLDVGKDEHYFFWFFESRKDPENAPFTVWLNGGPGCSSMIGLFQELGPCAVSQDGSQANYNPDSWNQVSNLLFFDQPDGVGFSYGKDNVYSTEDAAPLSYNLVQVFFEAFPKYKHQAFHFYGESYGGHYVPAFADYILKKNLALTANSKNIPINLQSIGVGNGFTDPLIQNQYYEKMACDSSYGSVLSKADCQSMKDHTPKCVELSQKCYDTGTNHDCITADNYCNQYIEGVFDHANKSYYDVRTSEELPGTYIEFLNTTSTMDLIGAKQWYQECADAPGAKFQKTGDDARNFAPHVADLLNHGVRVLLYAGDADYICNWYGNHAWAQKLEFHGSKAYTSDQLKPWKVDGKEVGQVQAGGNLTFVRVYEAGHEVPYYQPKAALQMFTNQIQGKSF